MNSLVLSIKLAVMPVANVVVDKSSRLLRCHA